MLPLALIYSTPVKCGKFNITLLVNNYYRLTIVSIIHTCVLLYLTALRQVCVGVYLLVSRLNDSWEYLCYIAVLVN